MWHISFTKILYMNDNGFLKCIVTKIHPPQKKILAQLHQNQYWGCIWINLWYQQWYQIPYHLGIKCSKIPSIPLHPWYQIPNLSWSFNVQVNYGYYNYYIYLLIYLLLSKFIRYMLIQLHTHSIFSNCIYYTIYTPYV